MMKRSFRRFRYTECDDFAKYLSSMASKGWHFKGWKMGMIFEKGEPEEIEYAVDVFGHASDMDIRPEANTKEFAEYCEVAGWKFIDSDKKFCVFQKIHEDAVDIVTPKERFENASKAEMKAVLLRILGAVLLAGLYMDDFFSKRFPYTIFHYSLIVVTSVLVLQALYHILVGVKLAIWYQKTRKRVSYGENIYLGIGEQKQKKKDLGRYGLMVLMEMVILIALYLDNDIGLVFPVMIALLFMILCMGGIAYSRPSRGEHVASVIGVSVIVSIITIVIALGFSFWDGEIREKSEVPLLQEDYREVELSFDKAEVDKRENVFGGIEEYWVVYYEYDEETDEDYWDEISYRVFESRYPVILNRIWNILKEGWVMPEDCTKLWGAEEAVADYEYFHSYYVRYEEQIFVLEYEGNLTQEQVDIICKKMNLGQVK